MQPGKSQLLDSLKVYLNKSNRLQPIIGLKSIIECVNFGKQNREPLYWCEVCVCQLSKADIRNHILGSHHRFNYIKAWHPHLVSGWQEKSHLSEMAWPLMEIAKKVERDEGSGDAQLLEVEDAVFQKIATQSENNAVNQMDFLIDAHAEAASSSDYTPLHCPDQSQTTLLLEQNQHGFLQEDMKPHRISSVKSNVWLENISTSRFYYPEALSEINHLLDDYTGAKPLIGRNCVVEYRSEDGYSKCFLCHCCRIRSDQKDVVDHLTSSSHLLNYLTETHPEQVEEMRGDIKNNYQFLQSLARKAEREEGRGDLKIVYVPESLCRLLTAKSYHWCIQMLHTEWTHSNVQNKKITHKGPRVIETSGSGRPQKHTANSYKWGRSGPKKKRKMKMVTDTVFSVSLPLTGGAVMVERTHSNKVKDPVMTGPTLSDWDLVSSQEKVDQDLDHHRGSFTVNPDEEDNLLGRTAQLQPDLYSEDQETDHQTPARNLTVTLVSKDLNENVSDCLHYNQHEDGTKDYKELEEEKYSKYHDAPETSNRFYESWLNEEEGQFPAASHAHDWSPTFAQEGSGSELLYNSTSKTTNNPGYSAVQHYQQRHLQSRSTAGEHTSWWRFDGVQQEEPGLVDDVRGKMHTCFRSTSGVPAEPAVQPLQSEQRPVQTYMEFPAHPSATQSYWGQSPAYQAGQTGQGFMWYPNYHVNYNNLRPILNFYTQL